MGFAEGADNRIVWAAALAASQGTSAEEDMARAKPLIAFVVAFMDGTGSVERFLGTRAGFLDAHQAQGEHESAELCLDIAKEGPITAEEMILEGGETLRFTDFSRECARLWHTQCGRRFSSYRQRTNKGVRNTGWRLKWGR